MQQKPLRNLLTHVRENMIVREAAQRKFAKKRKHKFFERSRCADANQFQLMNIVVAIRVFIKIVFLKINKNRVKNLVLFI